MDLLLSRYNDIRYVLDLPFIQGINLINKAIEKDIDNRIWQRWLIDYSRMNKDNFKSFKDYKIEIFGPSNVSKRSTEEILKEAEEIRKKIKK